MPRQSQLHDIPIHVRFKLAALWSSLIFCYIYGDYFELYQPGKLQQMLAGQTALGAATQGMLFAMAALMAIPSLMVFLSLALPATICRWTNIVLGLIYSAIMMLAISGSWHFYILLGAIEILLSLLIVWHAWRWPKLADA